MHIIQLLYDIDIHVISLTLDGHPSNMSMIRKLGCSTSSPDFVTHFTTDNGVVVHVFIDACHSLKLVRNSFARLGSIFLPDLSPARWSHLGLLNLSQKNEGLTAANKLSDRHMNFQQQKMKVNE